MTILDELLTLERRGWDALCDGTADEFYGSTMTADGVMVLANGMILDRAAVTSALGDSPAWARYELADARTIEIDRDNAVLIYVGTAYRDGADEPFVGAMSSVYHRTGESWQLVLYQQSEIAAS